MSSTSPSGWARVVSMEFDTGVSNTDFITNDTTPKFWIRAFGIQPGEEVVISWTGGGATGWHRAQYDSASGLWYYQMTTPLAIGNNTILVALHDMGSERGRSTGQVVSVLDTPALMATIDSYTDNVGHNQGDFASAIPTDDRTLTLKGTVDATFLADMASGHRSLYNLVLYKDGVRLGQVTDIDQTTGLWTYDLDANKPHEFIDHGEQGSFAVQIEDIAGGVSHFSPDFIVDVHLNVGVDFLTTSNQTPVLSGDFAFELLPGEYVEVTVNGKTYSSQTGAVILDDATGRWQLQIPVSDAIPAGTYDVVAILHRNDGSTVVHDTTLDELTILAPPPPPPPPPPPVNVDTGVKSLHEKYTAITLNDEGQWTVATNGALMEHRAVDSYSLSNFEIINLPAIDKKGGQNATFIDINRDGLMDVIINDANGKNGQQIFINQGGGKYYSSQIGASGWFDQNLAANVNVEYGGVIGFDKTGNGYVDIAYGDARPYGSNSTGWDSQIVVNVDGNLTTMVKDRHFTDARNGPNKQKSFNWGNAQAAPEISGVDLNNDGTVDLIFHANTRSSTVKQDNGRSMGSSSDKYRLVVASNNGDGSYRTSQVINDVFQNNQYDNYGVANGVAMTWADFNGDGYMDLFIGRGRAHNSKTGNFYGKPHSENESRILFNDGQGNLGSTKPGGVGKANDVHWMGDNLQGGASLAVDWNGDGKMDVIELPSFGDRNGVTFAGNTGPVNLYTNVSSGGVVDFTTSNLLGGNNTIGVNGTVNTAVGSGGKKSTRPTDKSDFVTGAVLADLDWDGALDLMILTRMGNTQTIMNNNVIADGTSLHIRIVDEQGMNVFFGNTVQLVDSSGKVVAVQIINPQSGNQTNDSTGLVHFYGLDPNETYSVVLLRNVNGTSADVGGIPQLGGNGIEHVNASWGGIRAGKANEAHILTAESDTNIANANIGKGIIGTGYNDTFYATKGTDSYDGAGGTVLVQGVKQWSATGGRDIIDFKLAGNQSITVDLNTTSYQNTGFNTVRLVNIEGVSGGNGHDTFIGNGHDNVFNGRGGDDSFYLSVGGQDTLVYEMIDTADDTGGNGHDTVHGFTVGDILLNMNADRLDLSELLQGYQAGVSDLTDFVSVRHEGNNTVLSVDIDGAASGHDFADMITFTNVHFDLATLINNQQIII